MIKNSKVMYELPLDKLLLLLPFYKNINLLLTFWVPGKEKKKFFR